MGSGKVAQGKVKEGVVQIVRLSLVRLVGRSIRNHIFSVTA